MIIFTLLQLFVKITKELRKMVQLLCIFAELLPFDKISYINL